MPELPEVETARRSARQYLAGKRICAVYAARDPIVFDGAGPRKINSALKHRKILCFSRKGKYIWMELDSGPSVLFHFGMTGRFHFYTDKAQRSRFCKLELRTDDGRFFAMTNKRRLGRIRLLDDPLNSPPVIRLGFDVYSDPIDASGIYPLLRKRIAAIKAVMLDQRLFAGVGNWIADEVLYQAGVDPRRLACKLSPDDAKRICRCLKRIVKKAVAVSADKKRFPKTWLFHYRWGKDPRARDHYGDKIHFTQIAGRTTAWVPEKQT